MNDLRGALSTLKIFLSYSWSRSEVADNLDAALRSAGVRVVRDVRELKPLDSLAEFISHSVNEVDYVVPILSAEYFRSPNCMAELLTAINQDEDKVLPIQIGKYSELFNKNTWAELREFWTDRAATHPKRTGKGRTSEILPDAHRVTKSIPEVARFVESRIIPSVEMLVESGYRDLLDRIGFKESRLVAELLKIDSESNLESREILLDGFLEKYPEFALAHHVRATALRDRSDFLRARKSYERSLSIDPAFPDANCDYALLLENQFGEMEAAEEHYIRAIELDGKFDLALNNYGSFLERNERYDESEGFFRRALKLNPLYTGARMNLATLLAERLNRKDEARIELELVLTIDDKYAEAHTNYAILMADYFGNREAATKHHAISKRLRSRSGYVERGWRPA